MIMRQRLFAFLVLCFDIGYALLVEQNQPCNKDRDILLAEDPTGNPQAFLRCTGVGVGTIGFWERRFCPHDMNFDFIKQQCRSPSQPMQNNNIMIGDDEHEVKNIGILNGTCAHGENCIGGTVCDLETLRCLCPYGTIANLETLSCHQLSNGFNNNYEASKKERNCCCNRPCVVDESIPAAKIVPSPNSGATPSYFKPLAPIIGELKNLAQSVGSSINFNSFTQAFTQAPTFSSYGGSNNNNYNNYGNMNKNGGTNGGFNNIHNQPAPPPRPSVFLPEAQPIHPISSLVVPPGKSCAMGEQCGGGSFCTKPLNLCLCPGELEDHGGNCIVPSKSEPPQPIMKVGIGAMCNRYAACDYDSTCINGRCQCVDPLIEHNGKCVLKLVPREVGPGELCDNGEVCSKGSVCDSTIPVCVCPSGSDLDNGACVEVKTALPYEPIPTQPVFRPDPQTISKEIYGNANYNNYGTPPTPPMRGVQVVTYAPSIQPPPPTPPPPPMTYTAAPERTPKPNVMKLNLGGAKQAGVGVRCSLNTDCMIGAYCNGNTQPPTCQCLSTHVNINGRCEKVIYPGQVGCEHDQQCTAAYSGTSCIDRQCLCPAGSKAIEQTCVSEFAYPGDLCNLSRINNLTYPACSGNSFCSNTARCECESGLIVFQRQCVNKSEIYLAPSVQINCHRDSDCLPDFLCIEHYCECPPNRVRLNAQCVELTNVNPPKTRRTTEENGKTDKAIFVSEYTNPTMGRLWSAISKAVRETKIERKTSNGKDSLENLILDIDQEKVDKKNEQIFQKRSILLDRENGVEKIEIFIPENTADRDHFVFVPDPNSNSNTDGHSTDNNFAMVSPTFKQILNSVHRPKGSENGTAPDFFPLQTSTTPSTSSLPQIEEPSSVPHTTSALKWTRVIPNSSKKLKWTLITPKPTSTPIPFDLIKILLHGINPYEKRPKRTPSSDPICWPDQTTCADGLGICIEQLCQCTNNLLYKHGKCVPEILEIESICDLKAKSPVCPPNAICRDGVCQCTYPGKCGEKDGKRNALDASTVKVKNHGEACQEGDICMNGTVCTNEICACPSGFVFEDLNCVKASGTFNPINSQCHEHDRCSGGSVCTNSICSCIDGSIESQGRCRQRPGGRCSYGQTCAGGSVCELGVCQCPAGKRMLNHTCITSIAKPGQSCQSGEKCTDGSLCRFGVCMCTADYHVVDHRCEKITSKKTFTMKTKNNNAKEMIVIPPPARAGVKAKPGHLCLDGEECIGGSNCREGYCVCTDQQIVIDDKCITTDAEALQVISEITKAAPGQYCDEKINCTGNSVCLANICECPDGTFHLHGVCQEHVPKAAFTIGLKESPGTPPTQQGLVPGSMCKVSIECPYRTECIRGVCRCKTDETIVNGMCRKAIYQVSPMAKCDPRKGLDCIGEAHCYYGICVCLYGLINIGTECASPDVLAEVPPGASCDRGQTCQGGAKCIGEVCRCASDEVVDVNKKCTKKSSTVAFYMYPGAKPNATSQKGGGKSSNFSNHPGFKELGYPMVGYPSENGKIAQIVTANHMTVNLVDPHTLRTILSKQLEKLPALGEQCEDKCNDGAKCLARVCRCESGYTATAEGKCMLLRPNSTPTQAQNFENNGPYQIGATQVTVYPTNGSPREPMGYSFMTTPPTSQQGPMPNQGFSTTIYPSTQYPAFRGYPSTTPMSTVYGCTQCNNNQNFPYQSNVVNQNGGQNGASMNYGPTNQMMCTYCPPNFPNSGTPQTYGSNMQNGKFSNSMPSNSAQLLNRIGPTHFNKLPTSDISSTNEDCSNDPMCNNESPNPNPNAGLPGQTCAKNFVCYNGATCIRNLCICKPGYKPINGVCQISKAQLGQMCLIDEQCQLGSYCYNGVCRCPNDAEMIEENGSRSCVDKDVGRPGEACKNRLCGYTSHCNSMSGVCECPLKMETRDGECQMASRLQGNQCYSSGFCDRSAYCDNGYCVCKVGQNSRFCQPIGSSNRGRTLAPHPQATNFINAGGGQDFGSNTDQLSSSMTHTNINNNEKHQVDLLENSTPLKPSNPKDPFKIFTSGINQPMQSNRGGYDSLGEQMIGSANAYPIPMPANGQPMRGYMSMGPNQVGPIDFQSNPPVDAGSPYQQSNFGSAQTLWPINTDSAYYFNQFHPMARGVRTFTDPNPSPVLTKSGGTTNNDEQILVSVAMPGEYCGTGRICLGNSHCSLNYCQCPEGTKIHNGICSYADGVQLSKNHIPKIRHPKSTQPRLYANPLESCDDNLPCADGSTCKAIDFLGPICQCNEGTTFFVNTCILERSNIEVMKVGQQCTMLQLCANGSYCKEGKCECPRDTQPVSDHCVKISLPGEPCEKGEICSVGSVCDREALTCVCPMGKQIRNGICEDENEFEAVQTRYRQNKWKSSQNLTDMLYNLASIQRKKTAHHLPETTALPGQYCNEDTKCLYESYCSALGHCTCLPGLVVVYERCFDANKVRLPGETCVDGEDVCSKNSWCNKGKCACIDGKSPVDFECGQWKKTKPPFVGDLRMEKKFHEKQSGVKTFTIDEDQRIVQKESIDGSPTATPLTNAGPLQMKIKVKKIKKEHNENNELRCSSSVHCPNRATCKNSICFCEFEGIRMPPSLENSPSTTWICNLDEDCQSPNLSCIDGQCTCSFQENLQNVDRLNEHDFTPAPKNELVSQRVYSTVNRPINIYEIALPSCHTDLNCTNGTSCSNRTCMCENVTANGSFSCKPLDGNSFPIPKDQGVVEEGGKCEFSNDCLDTLTCFNGTCVCMEEKDGCLGEKRVKRKVEEFYDFYTADEKIRSPPGGSCSEVEECSGGSVCREGWCVCPDPTMIVMRGICVQTQPRPTVPPHTTPRPEYNHHVAQGSYNSLQNQNQRPQQQGYETIAPKPNLGAENMLPAPRKAAPGTNCGPLDICVGGSTCVDNYCICPAGHTASVDTGRCEPQSQSQDPQSRLIQESRKQPIRQETTQDKSDDVHWYTHLPSYPPKTNPVAIRPEPVTNNNPIDYFARPQPITTLVPQPVVTVKAPPSSYVVDGRGMSSNEYNPNPNIYAPTTSKGYHVIESTEEKQHVLPEPDFGEKTECEKRGLICKGGTICVNLTCQCPQGHILHNDQCVPPEKKKYTNKRRGKSWNRAPRYSRPNEPCSNGEICTGGSECREKQTCVCPTDRPIIRESNCIASDEKPMIRHIAGPGEECNKETKCTEQSICYQGICRCQSGFIAISGKCVQLSTTQQIEPQTTQPPTTRIAIMVGPGETCGKDRSCSAGSNCENGVCTCPLGSSNVSGKCQTNEKDTLVTQTLGKSYRRLAGTERTCNDDTQCGANSICIVGKCKCRTGYKDENGVCKIIEDVAVAHNRTYSSISSSQQQRIDPPSKSTHPSYSESEAGPPPSPRPRIVGPPIRKPKTKPPPTAVVSGGRISGVGVCPPGNDPLRDESSGDLVSCNGLTPNCPPKSYCYVTGVASETYNCCKSW